MYKIITNFFIILLFHILIAEEASEIELFIFEDIPYLSLEEFFISQNLKYNIYSNKSKIDFLYQNQRTTFSNNSSFVKIDDTIYHMIKNVKFVEQKFYAPLNSFIRLYTQFEDINFIVNYKKNKIYIQNNQNISLEAQELNQEFLNTIKNEDNWKITTIIIDPGHGGKDPGAIGYHNIKEKHIVLDIAKELGSFLRSEMPELNILYTRDDDTFLGLKNRTEFANKQEGHMFLSIHANASTAKTARGFEIFLLQPNSVDKAIDVAIRENASIFFEDNPEQYEKNQMIASVSEKMYLQESEKLAISIENAVKKELPKTRMRGIKQAGFYVLVGAAMPKVLIEAGFITNKSEAKLLNKSSYRSEMAYGIFKGVQAYINSHNSQAITK
mgnify:CR=1 FL=1|tara:strand:+ start:806 stop:1957 length:1152 start_codon:yes stop_codon:yes gene_type:complete